MMSRYCFWMLLVIMLSSGCTEKKHKKYEELDKEIMTIHDEVMPRIGEVLSLRKKIQLKLDSCSEAACKDTLEKLSYGLTRADAHMMRWMRAYRMPEGKDTAEQYLLQQKEEINSVRTEILEGIENARKYLNIQ